MGMAKDIRDSLEGKIFCTDNYVKVNDNNYHYDFEGLYEIFIAIPQCGPLSMRRSRIRRLAGWPGNEVVSWIASRGDSSAGNVR
jgi:hypothetical protein